VGSAERLDLCHAVFIGREFKFGADYFNERLVVANADVVLGEAAQAVVDEDGDVQLAAHVETTVGLGLCKSKR
jgi:hypothetical protein